jgi:preflagellin peptidase FlaK
LTLEVLFIAARVAITVGFLVYASWSDFKTREVSNRVWAIYAPIAIALMLAELVIFNQSKLILFGVSAGLTVGLAFLLFYSGGFGGADSKALMCIAFALPFAPEATTPLVNAAVSPTSQFIYPLTIFSNAVLFAAASAVYMVIRNIAWHHKNGKDLFSGSLAHESLGKKIIVLLTGYKMTVAKVSEKWHVFPMEDVGEDDPLKRKLVVVPHDEGRDKVVERLSNAAADGKIDGYVWATPGLPMLIFVTLGLIVALTYGDLVWMLIHFLV